MQIGREGVIDWEEGDEKEWQTQGNKRGRRTIGRAEETRTELRIDGADLRRQAAKCSHGAEARAWTGMNRAELRRQAGNLGGPTGIEKPGTGRATS